MFVMTYVCDEFPFLYFAQHWYKRHVTNSVTIYLYLFFNIFFFSSIAPSQVFLGSLQALEAISAAVACWEAEAVAGSEVQAL